MATTVGLICIAAMVITVLPSATESLPFRLDNDHPFKRRPTGVRNLQDESMEVGAQTDGGDQESEESSSEENREFGSSFSIGSSIGAIPTDPPVPPDPVDPPVPPGPVDPGQGGPDTSNPNPGPDNPVGGTGSPETPPPTLAPQPPTMPSVVPPTTRPRGDVELGSYNPKQFGNRGNPRPDPKPIQPQVDNNIVAISREIEEPSYPNKLGVPLGALLTVVVIGGLVVVLAVGGVAYFFATRVRIS